MRISIAYAATAALALTSIGAATLISPSLPKPANCSREQLIRWVVVRDLTLEPAGLRIELAQRFEREFRQGIDWKRLNGHLTDTQRQRLWQNLPPLIETWLCERAAVYASLPAAERTQLLDHILDMLAVWRGVEQLQPATTSNEPEHHQSLLEVFQQRMKTYVERAPSPDREQMGSLLLGLQMRGIARQFGGH